MDGKRLFALLFLFFSVAQSDFVAMDTLNLTNGYSSHMLFYFNDTTIFVVMDVLDSNTISSPSIGVIDVENSSWIQFAPISVLQCNSFPCTTNSFSYMLNDNTVYLDIGFDSVSSPRYLVGISLVNLEVFSTIKVTEENVISSNFIKMSDTDAVYVYQKQDDPSIYGALVTLPTLAWQGFENINIGQWGGSFLPLDEETFIYCDSFNCTQVDIAQNTATLFSSQYECNGTGTYYPPMNTFYCISLTPKSMELVNYYVSSMQFQTGNTTALSGRGQEPGFLTVDFRAQYGYLATNAYQNQTIMYQLDVQNSVIIEQLVLQPSTYFINQFIPVLPNMGRGTLAVTMYPTQSGDPYAVTIVGLGQLSKK